MARLPAQFARPGRDPGGPEAQTIAPITHGGNLAQGMEHAAPVQHWKDFTFKVVETAYTGASGVPLESANQSIELPFTANYIIINPSLRGNDVYVALGTSKISWLRFGTGAGILFLPMADFVARGNGGSCRHPIMPKPRHQIAVTLVPPSNFTAPYTDFVRIGFGYIPPYMETIIGEDRYEEAEG